MMFPKYVRIVNKQALKEYAMSHPTCEMPGCEEKLMDMPHHIKYKSEGGSDVPSNLISLCSYHHRLGHQDKKRWKEVFTKIKEKSK